MAFRELGEFLEAPPLVLRIRGKGYSFPTEISARTWMQVHSVFGQAEAAAKAQASGEEFDASAEVMTDVDQEALMRDLCGDALQEMVDDGLTSRHLDLVMATLLAYHMSDRETAEALWNAQGEAPAPNRATRRSKAPAKSTRSRGSRAESTAPGKKRPSASAGPTSSPTGS